MVGGARGGVTRVLKQLKTVKSAIIYCRLASHESVGLLVQCCLGVVCLKSGTVNMWKKGAR